MRPGTREVIWWGFLGGDAGPSPEPWTAAEREALAARGVSVAAPGARRGAESSGWRRPVLAAAERLVLVRWRLEGAAPTLAHPLADEIAARLDRALAPCTVTSEAVLARSARHVVAACSDRAPAPEVAPRAVFRVPQEIIATDRLSPSSLEKLLGCPVAWVLEYAAGLRRRGMARIPSGGRLLGTFAHALLEDLLHGDGRLDLATGTPDEAAERAGRAFDARVASEAAPLVARGAEVERHRAREVVREAARALFALLQAGGWRVRATEEALAGRFEGADLAGSATSSSRRTADPRCSTSSSRASAPSARSSRAGRRCRSRSTRSWRADGGPLPPTGYFVIDHGELLTVDRGAFPGARELAGASMEETLAGARDALGFWRIVLGRGLVASRHEELREAAELEAGEAAGRPAPSTRAGRHRSAVPLLRVRRGLRRGAAGGGAMSVHVVSASAGTGKTYRLTGEVDARRCAEGTARPEGVVAITYTKKAAAELESRIRTELIRAGRADLAARVRDGYLGTVHSVCERLLRELALEAGHSPWLEPIAEPQRERLFAEALAAVLAGREARDRADRRGASGWRAGRPARSGASWSSPARTGSTAPPCATPRSGASRRCSGSCRRSRPPASEYQARLVAEAERRTGASVALTAPGKAGAARRDAVAELVRACARGGGLPPWAVQVRAMKQEWTVPEQPIVARLDEAVREHLACGRFRADLEELTRELFAVAADALDAYAQAKQAARVVDFQDMLALAARLLDGEGVAAALAGRLDLVVVDEFQDTSPMQLAVVSALARLARRSVWVGDRKQAIFGFQGSDPVLMGAAMEHALGGREPEFLSESWRSRPPLVGFTSELFARALARHGFTEREVRISTPAARPDPGSSRRSRCSSAGGGRGAASRTPSRTASRASSPRRRRSASGTAARRGRSRGATWPCSRAGTRTAARSPPPSPRGGSRRGSSSRRSRRRPRRSWSAPPSRSSPTRRTASRRWTSRTSAAAAPPTRTAGSRRGSSRPPATARRASGPGRLAPPRPTPPSRSRTSRGSTALRALHDRSRALAPAEALDAAIAAAGVLELLRTWPAPAQRIANVEALRAAARAYEDLCRVRRSAGTVAGLVEHLATLADQRDADRQAVPGTEDAVTLSTWHSAKGLEWPVVVLGSLGFAKDRDPWDVAVVRPATFDPVRPLAGRWVRWWPWPYGKQSKGLELAERIGLTREATALREDEARERVRLLYVAFTRARDRLVLAGAVKKGSPVADVLEPLQDDRASRRWRCRSAHRRGRPSRAPGPSSCRAGCGRSPAPRSSPSRPARRRGPGTTALRRRRRSRARESSRTRRRSPSRRRRRDGSWRSHRSPAARRSRAGRTWGRSGTPCTRSSPRTASPEIARRSPRGSSRRTASPARSRPRAWSGRRTRSAGSSTRATPAPPGGASGRSGRASPIAASPGCSRARWTCSSSGRTASCSWTTSRSPGATASGTRAWSDTARSSGCTRSPSSARSRKPLLAAFIHLPMRGELVELDVAAGLAEWRNRSAA